MKTQMTTLFEEQKITKNIHRQRMTTKMEKRFCKCSFGLKSMNRQNKTILLMGETGSGISTLINGMVNYIMCLNWEDNFRFEMIPKETGATKAQSQTSDVTAYTINHREEYRVPFCLTVIDTPGFGNNQGHLQDKDIAENIRELFFDPNDISSIDAVGFVVQSSVARLSPSQKYIFESISSVFGKGIADNTVILCTFSDRQTPPALEAINEAKVPCARQEDGSPLFFMLNNSGLYGATSSNTEEEQLSMKIDEMYCRLGFESMKSFIDKLQHMQPLTLRLTNSVPEGGRQQQSGRRRLLHFKEMVEISIRT